MRRTCWRRERSSTLSSASSATASCPRRALAIVFRAKYLEALDRTAAAGTLALPDSLLAPDAFPAWLASFRQQDWVVYAKPPFAGPEQVLQYLGRYTHRVALSNDRLVDLQDGAVRFRWNDYRDGGPRESHGARGRGVHSPLPSPCRARPFRPIRHFGFLANRTRQAKLERCRQLLSQPQPPPFPTAESVPALLLRLTGIDIERCPVCGQGRLGCVEMLRPTRPARPIPARPPDTS